MLRILELLEEKPGGLPTGPEACEVSALDKPDLEAIALTQAEELARRTRELIDHQGWCLWECSVLGGEVVAVVRDELVEGIPEGMPVYTEAELRTLFDKPVPRSTLRLVHEAKKQGAVVKGVVQLNVDVSAK